MAANLRFLVRRGTAEEWAAANSVLLGGEVALDTTHRKLKVGDGSTAWKDLPFVTPEVVNALLETNGVYDALSAYQGWLLKEDVTDTNTRVSNLEQNITQIVNDGKVKVVNELKSTNSSTDALSAAQGWELKQAIDGKTSVGLVNDLTTGGTDKALTAEQGKVLKGLIPVISQDTSNPTGNTALGQQLQTQAFSAYHGNWLWHNAALVIDIAHNLTTTIKTDYDYNRVLGADQGAVIKSMIDGLQTQINSLSGGNGSVATISVGSVTTGAAGSAAKVTNVGTSSAAVLNFTIPRGATGAAGSNGVTPTIKVGTTTTGAAGSNASVTATTSGTTTTLNFTIPRGATGASGTSGYSTETWTFTLSNGSTVTKKVVLSS